MNYFLCVFLCLFVSAQAQDNDSELKHAIEKGYNPEQRQNYFDRMIFQVDVFSNSDAFIIPKLDLGINQKNNFKPKEVIKMKFSFDYKFLGLNFSMSPNFIGQNKRDPTKGETNTLDLKFRFFYSDRLGQEVVYRNIKGFYLENPNTKKPIELFSDLEIETLGGRVFFIFNKNFSYRAFESMTERQLKSNGSFVPAVSFYYNNLKTNKESPAESYLKEIESYETFIQAGYMYNFVLAKKWFSTLGIHPGIGIYKSKNYYANPLRQTFPSAMSTNINYTIDLNAAVGYNNKNFFSGVRFNYKNLEYNNSNKTEIVNSKISIGFFAGYRFREVNPIKKAFNYVEKKLGI